MQEKIDRLESEVFFSECAKVQLSSGETIPVPRWSARKALLYGGKIGAALKAAGDLDGSGKGPDVQAVLEVMGEIVCGTLDRDAGFLDSITMEDFAEIALTILSQEFFSEGFRLLSKKASALLRMREQGGSLI